MNEENEASPFKQIVTVALIPTVLIFGVFYFLAGITIVDQGERGVVVHFGKIEKVLQPGFSFINPIGNDVYFIDIRNRSIAFEDIENKQNALAAASKDLQDAWVGVVVNYRIDQDKTVEIYQNYKTVEEYQARVLEPMVKDVVKSVTPQFTAEELIIKRSEVNTNIENVLRERFGQTSAIADRINIVNIRFSPSFTNAIEQKVTAEQQALAQRNLLEKSKYEAQQKIETAKGEAESIRIQSQALTEQPQFLEKMRIEKWNGVLPVYVGSGVIPFMNLSK